MEDKQNMIDKYTNDDTKIVMTSKSVKWILGILGSSLIALGGFAWGLYTSVDGKVDKVKTELEQLEQNHHKEVIQKLEKLEDMEVKKNTTKNFEQDTEIGILFDRTNSRGNQINHNAVRPPTTNDTTGPNIP
jgi:predicted RecB family endonuclease